MPLRIRTKIIISFGSVGVVLFMLVAVIFYEKTVLFNQLRHYEKQTGIVTALAELQLALDRVVMPPNDYLITGDIGERDKFRVLVKGAEEGFKGIREAMTPHKGPMTSHNEVAALYRDALRKFKDLKKTSEAIFAIPHPIGSTKGVALMKKLDAISHTIIINNLDKFIEHENADLKNVAASAEAMKRRVDTLTIVGILTGILLFCFFTLYLFRSILRPIMEFKEGAKRLGDDLDYRIEIRDGVEINMLADDFNSMAGRLRASYAELEKKVEERTAELKGLNQALKTLSITDGLTGLFNHRYFYDKLTDELKRAERYGRRVTLIMIDIDYFKRYNDTYGHLEGDSLLKALSACLNENVRGQDIISRYGGEEFTVILPETVKAGGVMLAERLRGCIAGRNFRHGENQPGGRLTISLGVAAFPDDARDPLGLIEKADSALYRAKERGRNRVETAGEGRFKKRDNAS